MDLFDLDPSGLGEADEDEDDDVVGSSNSASGGSLGANGISGSSDSQCAPIHDSGWLREGGWQGRDAASVARLLRWADAAGVELRGVELACLGKDRGHGFRAVQPLGAGEHVVCLPRKAHVTPARCHRDMPVLRQARAADFSSLVLWLVHVQNNNSCSSSADVCVADSASVVNGGANSRSSGSCSALGTLSSPEGQAQMQCSLNEAVGASGQQHEHASAHAPAQHQSSDQNVGNVVQVERESEAREAHVIEKELPAALIYTQALPGPAELHNAVYMDEGELAATRALGDDYADAINVVLGRVNSCNRYIQELQAAFPRELGGPAFSAERLRWAQAIVCSRGLSVNGASMLLPVVDMLNHAPDGCVLRYNDAGALLVTTRRAYAAGEEVCLCYGDKQPPELLANYGYVLPP